MNIGSICKHNSVTIDYDMSLHQAAQHMRNEHVGALVVTRTPLPRARRRRSAS